jgi:hypothetical protein
VDEDQGPRDGGRGEQVLEVAADAGRAVIAVDQHQVDVATALGELRQQAGQDLVAVAGVEGDPVEPCQVRRRRDQVERVDLAAVGGDPAQAAPLGPADLDRELGLGELEDTLQRRALADRHLLRAVEERLEAGRSAHHQTVESTPSSSSIGFV